LGAPAGGGAASRATPLSTDEYQYLTGTIRETVDRVVPPNATVLVASRGDGELLRLGVRRALHFPQDEDGKYAGYHPADSDAVIAMLEQLRTRGADHFLLPATAFWWLDYYEGFREYVEKHYDVVASGDDCWIARLGQAPVGGAEKPSMGQTSTSQTTAEIVSSLLPEDERVVFLALGRDGSGSASGHESCVVAGDARDDDSTALERLDTLVSDDVRFVVVPEPLFDWAEDHPSVRARLANHYRLVMRQEHFCEIYELRSEPTAATGRASDGHGVDGDGTGHERGTESRPTFWARLKAAIFGTRSR
jgi:hypothetical protein